MKKITCFLLLAVSLSVANAQQKNFIDQPYLEVSGSADSLLTPNEIFIRIVISEKDTRDKISLEDLELKMYEAIKKLGIDVDKNLVTSDMSSNFKYYFLKSKDVLKSKQYILKVSDAVMATRVFMELEALEISNTSIQRVSHSGLSEVRNMIRAKAVINARERARFLIQPLNQSLGAAIHIADNEVVHTATKYDNGLQEVVVVAYSSNRSARPEPPKIEFEKIRVTANVQVKFILNP